MSWDRQIGWWVAGLPYAVVDSSSNNYERNYVVLEKDKPDKIYENLRSCRLDNIDQLLAFFKYQTIPRGIPEKGTFALDKGNKIYINGIINRILLDREMIDRKFFETLYINMKKTTIARIAESDDIFSRNGGEYPPRVPRSTKKEKESSADILGFSRIESIDDLKDLINKASLKYNAIREKYKTYNIAIRGIMTLCHTLISYAKPIIFYAGSKYISKPLKELLRTVIGIFMAIISHLLDSLDALFNGSGIRSDFFKMQISALISVLRNSSALFLKSYQSMATIATLVSCFYSNGTISGIADVAALVSNTSRVIGTAKNLVRGSWNIIKAPVSYITARSVQLLKGIVYGLSYIPGINNAMDSFVNYLQAWENSFDEVNKKETYTLLQRITPSIKSVYDFSCTMLGLVGIVSAITASLVFFLGTAAPATLLTISAALATTVTPGVSVSLAASLLLLCVKLMGSIGNLVYFEYCRNKTCTMNSNTPTKEVEVNECLRRCWDSGVDGLSTAYLSPELINYVGGLDMGKYNSTVREGLVATNAFTTGTMDTYLANKFRVNIYDTVFKEFVDKKIHSTLYSPGVKYIKRFFVDDTLTLTNENGDFYLDLAGSLKLSKFGMAKYLTHFFGITGEPTSVDESILKDCQKVLAEEIEKRLSEDKKVLLEEFWKDYEKYFEDEQNQKSANAFHIYAKDPKTGTFYAIKDADIPNIPSIFELYDKSSFGELKNSFYKNRIEYNYNFISKGLDRHWTPIVQTVSRIAIPPSLVRPTAVVGTSIPALPAWGDDNSHPYENPKVLDFDKSEYFGSTMSWANYRNPPDKLSTSPYEYLPDPVKKIVERQFDAANVKYINKIIYNNENFWPSISSMINYYNREDLQKRYIAMRQKLEKKITIELSEDEVKKCRVILDTVNEASTPNTEIKVNLDNPNANNGTGTNEGDGKPGTNASSTNEESVNLGTNASSTNASSTNEEGVNLGTNTSSTNTSSTNEENSPSGTYFSGFSNLFSWDLQGWWNSGKEETSQEPEEGKKSSENKEGILNLDKYNKEWLHKNGSNVIFESDSIVSEEELREIVSPLPLRDNSESGIKIDTQEKVGGPYEGLKRNDPPQ